MSAAARKPSKKRTAPSQPVAPKSKKPHLEKTTEPQAKKRSRPVTRNTLEDSEGTSDEEISEDEFPEEDDLQEAGDEMEVAEDSAKNPNAARESHKAQRALLEQRKASKPHSALLVEAKRAWTLARQKNLSKADRTKYMNALMDVLRGAVKDIVFKHDASRIVQTAVKYGGQKERNEIAEELKGRYRDLAQNKYSKFLVTKLIRFCPAYRASILRELQGQVLRLLLHREASGVLADAFELYTNAYERSILLRDFYGKEASLFTVTVGSDDEKERSKRGLRGLMEGLEGERRKRILACAWVFISSSSFNNPDKGAVSHAIVHRATWEYLAAVSEIEDEAEADKLRREIFETCQDVLAEMVHTKDGSRVVREFIAWGTAKDRKHIVKTIKPHVERMCKDDEAQLVLFTSLDIIDIGHRLFRTLIIHLSTRATRIILLGFTKDKTTFYTCTDSNPSGN
uniref:Non-canonical non-ribosomal peptide synthetase FUB8 ) n=1 Tax=Ganoderma boninense TaxID=34458 RepID=A0A5K1JYG5_9APHY|nr:Non-canonical non-ribosomal peptide synthetase FUB8 (EC (Fusaric acid biosynthesis protein 8) [Ganoderma boninense]